MHDAASIYAELRDPARARLSLREYEDEMRRRFGERERWPKLDSELSPAEREALEERRRGCIAEWDRREADEMKAWEQFQYPAPPAAQQRAPATVRPKAARDLMARTFDPLSWTIEDLLPEGCFFLAARPKVGKSWMALQFAVAVTEGSHALGKRAKQGAVLFLALEDNERRLQSRFAKHELGRYGEIELLDYATEWPRGAEGAQAVEAWLIAHPDARLVVVDTLEKIRPARQHKSVYEDDYGAAAALKALADKYKVTVLIVAHNKKGVSESGDPIELVSGSLGLSGGADGVLVIDKPRGSPEPKFYVKGRDIEHEPDDGYVIRFNRATCKWEMLGDAKALSGSAAQRAVMDAIRDAGHPLTAPQVGKATRRSPQAARHILDQLVNAGKVVEIANSRPMQYELAQSAEGDA